MEIRKLQKLKDKNEEIKTLRQKLRQSPGRAGVLEVENILVNVTDRKAFILLLDMYETEKEITREMLESLIDHSFEMHIEIIHHLEFDIGLTKVLSEFFSISNIKTLAIVIVFLGLIFSLAINKSVSDRLLDVVVEKSEVKK